jgi:hypothetical protein
MLPKIVFIFLKFQLASVTTLEPIVSLILQKVHVSSPTQQSILINNNKKKGQKKKKK